MQFLNKSLLVISPHFRLFIKDQITSIGSFFANTTILIPVPHLAKLVLRVPFFHSRLLFLNSALESCKQLRASNGIDVVCSKFFSLPIETIRKRQPLLSAKGSIDLLKRNEIKSNIVHAHRVDVAYTGAVLKDMWGTPLVITSHGSDVYDFPFRDHFRYAITKYTLNRVDHVIAVCRSDAKKLLSLGLPSRKLSIIPNGFNDTFLQRIPKRTAREKLGLPPDKKILLSIGTLHQVKGHTYLIDAVHRLSRMRSDVVAVIIGSGPLESKLRAKIERLDLKQSVLLVGWKPHNQIPLWMDASDVFVLPSLNEGFPIVIPEAMACGKLVIGTRVGGIPDAIPDDGIGVLVDPEDAESLAQAISEALDRKPDSERIRSHASKYTLENIVKQIHRIYQIVMSDAD